MTANDWVQVSENAQRLQQRRQAVLGALACWVQARGIPQEEALIEAWKAYETERERQGLPRFDT